MATIDNLKVSEEAFQTAITEFEKRLSGLENSYLKISNEVRTLDSAWHGEASEKFKAQFDSLYEKLRQNEDVINNVISKLKAAMEGYRGTVTQGTTIYKGAETGTAYQSSLG